MKIKFSHELKIQHSRVFEVLSVITALIDDTYHSKVIDLTPFAALKAKYNDQLESFHKFGSLDFVWFEFALIVEERESIHRYFNSILQLQKNTQLIYFLAHSCEIDEIEKAMSSMEDMTTLLSEMKYNCPGELAHCLINFEDTCTKWASLAVAIDESAEFQLMLEDTKIKNDIEDQLNEFHQGLNNRHPLSYAQALMGKPFWNIGDYKHYEFIAVYFNSPYRFRIMDENTQIMVYSIYRTPEDPEKIGFEIAEIMKALGDPSRLKILQMLFMNPQYGKEIADATGLTTPTVSHHLELLHSKGLVNLEQSKQIKYFSTNLQILRKWLHTIENFIMKKG